MNVDFRSDFPIFNAPENKDLIYFDNAATTRLSARAAARILFFGSIRSNASKYQPQEVNMR